jgi:hypothetical protein
MGRGRRSKNLKDYIDGYKTYDPDTIIEVTKQEASRLFQDMDKWKKHQETYDPEGMLEFYVDDVFPMIDQARKYRGRIYERNRRLKVLIPELKFAAENGQEDKVKELQDELMTLTDEQMHYSWKIVKIYGLARRELTDDMRTGDGMESDPFDYEYNAADAY